MAQFDVYCNFAGMEDTHTTVLNLDEERTPQIVSLQPMMDIQVSAANYYLPRHINSTAR